ncbi:hypothetical protein [Nocardia terpenica]|uniref:hypothetical protein n=1 Tax=Nocardia terpenica TaxID=455432 RepID=UPI000833AF2A|nr:hypothetical protein [Nocardia terpenica]NQE89599.1 hypothetical protein [Nocardia terpenica]
MERSKATLSRIVDAVAVIGDSETYNRVVNVYNIGWPIARLRAGGEILFAGITDGGWIAVDELHAHLFGA